MTSHTSSVMGFLTTSLHKNCQNDVKLLETWWFWPILGKVERAELTCDVIKKKLLHVSYKILTLNNFFKSLSFDRFCKIHWPWCLRYGSRNSLKHPKFLQKETINTGAFWDGIYMSYIEDRKMRHERHLLTVKLTNLKSQTGDTRNELRRLWSDIF